MYLFRYLCRYVVRSLFVYVFIGGVLSYVLM